MGKFLAVISGLIAIAGGIVLIIYIWGPLVRDLIFACIPLFLILAGLIAFAAGISSLKDASRIKKLEEETEEDASTE